MNALVVIETLTPAVYSEPGGIEALLSKLEADVRAVDTDISTPAGRAAIKSLARKIASSKQALDSVGKDLGAEWKAKAKLIDQERAKAWDRLEALQVEVRKPLTDWEDAETRRVAGHQNEIQRVIDLASFAAERPTAAEVSERLAALESLPARDWQEFRKPAETARSETFSKLTILKSAAVKFEAEQAELSRLRAEQAAREQKEREDRIAAEAAEQARLIAEAKAAREAKEASDKADAELRKIEQDRCDAIARAEKAERDAAAAKAKAAKDKKDAADKADREKAAALKAERDRVVSIKVAEEVETARRAADREHKAKINSEALAALVAAGLSDADGVRVVTAIVKGEIPHVNILY